MTPARHREGELLYLSGDGASEEYCVAEIEGRRVGEHTQPVSAMGGHAKRAVPLVQGEEECGEVQRDENADPHGPVERPHEGSDGRCRVPATNLNDMNKKKRTLEIHSKHFILWCLIQNCHYISYSLFPENYHCQHNSNLFEAD